MRNDLWTRVVMHLKLRRGRVCVHLWFVRFKRCVVICEHVLLCISKAELRGRLRAFAVCRGFKNAW